MADYLLLVILIVWVTTGSVSVPAGSAQDDCVAPRLLGQSTRFSYLAVGEPFDGYCNFTNYENQTGIKFEHLPGNPNYNRSVVYMPSTVLAMFSIEHVDMTSQGLYSATACNSSCCAVCYISLSVEGACHNRQTPIPIVNYTELNIPINETVTIGCDFYGDPDQSDFDIIWGYGSKTEIVNRDTDNKYSKQHKWYSNCSFASFLTIMRVTEKDSGNYSCQSKSYSQPVQYGTKADTILDLVQRPVVTNSPDEIVEEDLFNPTVLEYIVENFSWFIAFTIESPNGTEPDVTIKPLFSSNWDKISVRLRAQALGHYRLCMAYKINVTTDDHTTFNCSKTTDFKEGAKWIGELLAAIVSPVLVVAIIIATIIVVSIVCWKNRRKKEQKYELVRQDSGLEVEEEDKIETRSVGSARRRSKSAEELEHVVSRSPPDSEPPTIIEHPDDQLNITHGEKATLSVKATGTGLTYQWKRNGVKIRDRDDIEGITDSTLTLAKVSISDEGEYTCVVSNSEGSAASQAAPLTVNVSRYIFTRLSTDIYELMDPVSILPYLRTNGLVKDWQYQKLTLPTTTPHERKERLQGWLPDSSSNFLELFVKSLNEAQEHEPHSELSAKIQQALRNAHSPQVIKHPSDKTDTSPESTVTFHITAIGKTPLKYQWYMKRRDGDVRMAIARASNSSHCIADLSKTDEGEYTCTVSNDDGKCTSNSAILTVADPPLVEEHPVNQEDVKPGTEVTFEVAATGTKPLKYQWHRDGVKLVDGDNIKGTRSSHLVISAAKKEAEGHYKCAVENSAKVVESKAAILTVADKPHVTSHPKDQLNIFPERRVTLSIAARGAAMSYQWLKDGVEITDGDGIVGSATNTLSIASVSKSTEGQYACVVRNIAGEDKSEIAIVKAADPPELITEPENRVDAVPGRKVTFSVKVSGSDPLKYQWQRDGVKLEDANGFSGTNTSTLTVARVSKPEHEGEYTCMVSNGCGEATSNAATLTVAVPPCVNVHPVNQESIVARSKVTFKVDATGTEPLAYQWQRDGVNLVNSNIVTGVTTSTLLIKDAKPNRHEGKYKCVISNDVGDIETNSATLSFAIPPCVKEHPESLKKIATGSKITFKAEATGTEPLRYQWKRDGENLPESDMVTGVTTSTLSIEGVSKKEHEGKYKCLVNNSAGKAESNAAKLTVVNSSPVKMNSGVIVGVQDDIFLTEYERTVLDEEAKGVLRNFPNLERAPLDRKVHFVYVKIALVEVRHRWNKVGSVLGLKDADIQVITQENQNDFDGCLNDMIAAWFAQSSEADPATLRKLVGAIATRTGGENPALAEKIAKGGLTEDNSVAENVDASVLSAQEKVVVVAALANEGLENEWNNIGIFLGLNSRRLNALNSMGDMIDMWLNKSYTVELFGEPSWQRLVAAVGSNAGARDKAAAEKIASLHRKPQVTKHPDNQENIVAGAELAISITATGTDPLKYQWQRDGVKLDDANGFTGTNTSTLTIAQVSKPEHEGEYTCVVSNDAGEATSNAATLTVGVG